MANYRYDSSRALHFASSNANWLPSSWSCCSTNPKALEALRLLEDGTPPPQADGGYACASTNNSAYDGYEYGQRVQDESGQRGCCASCCRCCKCCCRCMLLLFAGACVAYLTIAFVLWFWVDPLWEAWLERPPGEAAVWAAELASRADTVASRLPPSLSIGGEVDVVVSGGGNLDAYYLGAWSVLSRVQWGGAAGDFQMLRYAGASAGGMLPFELALKGENTTMVNHFSYGLVEKRFPALFRSPLGIVASLVQDHQWRIMASWQANRWAFRLRSLDDKIYLATSCFDQQPDWLRLVMIHRYTSPQQAASAFMATGTEFELYDGMFCTDGGATSGPDMTPLFQDALRPQIIVNLMRISHTFEEITHDSVRQIVELARQGQDDAAEFVQHGSLSSGAITLCPRGADVSDRVCRVSGVLE